MTPAEHLAMAEGSLSEIGARGGLPTDPFYTPVVEVAILHTLMAIAAELGVPHAGTTAGGEPGGASPAAG